MSYKRLSDEEIQALLEDLGLVQAASVEAARHRDLLYRALRELAELRQAAEVREPEPLPEDYGESAQ